MGALTAERQTGPRAVHAGFAAQPPGNACTLRAAQGPIQCKQGMYTRPPPCLMPGTALLAGDFLRLLSLLSFLELLGIFS